MNHSPQRRCLRLAAVLTYLLIAASRAETVHCRGPNYDGIDTTSTLALPWAETGPQVVWRRHIGQGYSGAIIVDRRIYTQIQRRDGQHVLCLDLDSGTTIWESRYNWPWQLDGEWPGPYATPTYSDNRIFFSCAFGVVGCMSADSGDLIWSRNILKEFKSKGVDFGYACTPLVLDGKVYVPAGGESCAVIALNADDGTTAWQSGSDRASYTPCMPVCIGGTTQILSYLEIAAYGSEPNAGETLWYSLWGSGYSPHGAWPLYREPYLYRTNPFRRGCRVDRIGVSNGKFAMEPVWANQEICADFFSSILVGDYIYGFDVKTPQADRDGNTRGSFVCLDFKTGRQMWRSEEPGHASVISSDGKLILLNERGELIICEPNPSRYTELARTTILPGEICWTMPAISRSYLFARNQKEAVCVYLGPNSIHSNQAASQPAEYSTPHWLDQFDSQSTWMPDWKNLSRWYVASLLIAFFPSWLAGLLFSRAGKPLHAANVFLASSFVLGIAGTRMASELLSSFVFISASTLYAALIWIHMYVMSPRITPSRQHRVIARILLAAFAGLCVIFWFVCGQMFLLGGWGFLTGFLPAVPLIRLAAKRLSSSQYDWKSLACVLLGFSIYFWCSAVILVWKAGLDTNLNAF